MDPVASDRSGFRRFLGVDLGGGKGKKTAVAALRRTDTGVVVEAIAPRNGDRPLYDAALVDWIRAAGGDAVVAVDAPLRLPACLRCQVPVCPGAQVCVDKSVVLMRDLAGCSPASREVRRGKPAVTPYTQRATEIYLHRRRGVQPRETLGQGMGPLSARAAHLLRALAGAFELNRNLIEVYPKATLTLLGFEDLVRRYKKHLLERQTRAEILARLAPDLGFAPGVWREECVQSDHTFDAVIGAYTGYLWARDAWQVPADVAHVPDEDGWIWVPPEPLDREAAE
jgi:predicted RNase H-like nuclease